MNSSDRAQQPQFVDKRTYLRTLTDRISQLKAGDRAAVMTMAFDTEQPEVVSLMKALTKAASRGVAVLVSVDAYSFMVRNYEQPNWLARVQQPSAMHGAFAQRYRMLRELEKHGGRYIITNRPTSRLAFPVVGRSHIKFAVVNNDVWVGGCNLDDMAHIDVMATWSDKALADWLIELPGRAVEAGSTRISHQNKDIALQTAVDAELLVDAGVPSQSRIMQQALRLIDEANERIFMTCQYFPSGLTSRHLAAAAKRGVQIELIYNDPRNRAWPHNWAHYAVDAWEQLVRPAMLFVHRLPREHSYVHAKLLITEKAAMLGSHNYVQAGVDFGTAEFALLSQDRTFAANVEAALRAQLATA